MILKSIEEAQQEFLEKLKPQFREWIEFVCNWYKFEKISENYYKNVLVYLPFPIGKLVYDRFKNNITIDDVFKYFYLKRMHTFSEDDDDKIEFQLACYSGEITSSSQQEDYYDRYDDIYERLGNHEESEGSRNE